ncbi:hypothetical protein PP182_14365 [Maribacter sp. PR1]|uniref:Haem-binding domain-containing protein n=1 Tax=Maribacter cobaltidurans TaxID=1178778 RepID=A0ABU7IWA1_9FLAO|nr:MULTISPECIES: hypothetical protein [Maribacter]MDC6389880.1 hypothetical protein [Maribacter sp. PR1]MEE1977270.1 hypothetical protein [Maribacter cobaltidurans]
MREIVASILFVITVLNPGRTVLFGLEISPYKNKSSLYSPNISTDQNSYKKEAFQVLVQKCNVCHLTKKRVENFTLENMDSLATDINKQVFIKKKMPKGKKITLTKSEKESLTLWLNQVLIK